MFDFSLCGRDIGVFLIKPRIIPHRNIMATSNKWHDNIMDKGWKFFSGSCLPVFPYYKAGEIYSSRHASHKLYYLIDNNFNLWLGLNRNKEVFFEYFKYEMAMEVISNYNILGCLEFDSMRNKALI